MERLKKTLIKPSYTIKQTLKQMDSVGEKTLFVVNKENEFLGAVSDGDIRRWILKGKSLTKNVTRVMNTNAVILKKGFTREEAKELMLSKVVESIPVVDDKKKLIAVISWIDLFGDESKPVRPLSLPVVIMSGGEGKRLVPFTNIFPKSLMPIGDKPIIELIIDRFTGFGCKEFFLSLNFKANILRAYFSEIKHDYKLSFIQENKPLGTIGGLHLLRNKLKLPFFVNNCDILIEADYYDIWEAHKKNRNYITLVVSLKHYVIPYGICEIENGGKLKGLKEKPEYDLLANTGLYLMEADVLKDIPKDKFYDVTDLIANCLKKGRKIGIYPVSEKSWIDIGQWQELRNSLEKFGHKRI